MSKHWMRGLWSFSSKVLAVAASGTARAGGLQAISNAATAASYGVPDEFSVLIWAPLLLLAFACVGGLLWLIWSDANKGRLVAAPQTAKRRGIKLVPTLRLPNLQA
jgi:hypothetical protein